MKKHQFNFPVIIERDEDGYFASCPDLEGCYSQGDTYEEAAKNIKEAVELYLEVMIEEGEKIPQNESVSFSTIQINI